MKRPVLAAMLVCNLAATAGRAAAPATAAEQVTFARKPATVGDSIEQSIVIDLGLKTTARRGSEVLEQSNTRLQRVHQRVTTTTAVGPHGAQAVDVTYRRAERTADGAEPKPEPVAGKSYHCERDGEQLRVTTLAGDLPPMDEYRIVAQSMETLGLPNPLVEFLAGRTVRVGEQLELPIELAAEVLGFEKDFGQAKRFLLTLSRTEVVEQNPCAVFKTEIHAGSSGSGQMGLIVTGELVMRVAGCRTVSAELSGPIGMSESRTAPGGPVQVSGVGKLSVAIKTTSRANSPARR